MLFESLTVGEKEALHGRALEAEARLGPKLEAMLESGLDEGIPPGFFSKQNLDEVEKAVALNFLMKRFAKNPSKMP